jgi:hypothetical protein
MPPAVISAPSRRSRKQPAVEGAVSRSLRFLPVLLLVVVILFFSIIRFHLRNVPLERDEGEYAYAGQLMLQGVPPYTLAYNMKLPGTYAAYALMMAVFGQTGVGIHLAMIPVNAATIILVFLLAERLFGSLAAIGAASSYALLSNSEAVLGFAGHATHFVVLAALAGILILLRAIESRRPRDYFLAGVFLGLAFILKQPGLFFVLFGAFWLVVCECRGNEWRGLKIWPGLRRSAVYGLGVIVPFALTCLLMFLAGGLGKMWYWTISYARQYASVTALWDGWQNLYILGYGVVEPCYLLWILGAGGLAAMAWDSEVRKHAVFTIGFLLFSWCGVCAGFYFRPHYFILVLPAVSLLAGITLASATREMSKHSEVAWVRVIPAVVFAGALGFSIVGQSDILFHMDAIAVSRAAYGNSPFAEAEVISQYLNRQTRPDATIAIAGSEPEIFFEAKRRSATGYIYVYPLFEPQKFALDMQNEMVKEIENSRPQYLILVKVITSWQVQPKANHFILGWFKDYIAAHYRIVGVADEVSPQTRYVWGDEAKNYVEQSDGAMEVYRRVD